jgi:hypothetical protein
LNHFLNEAKGFEMREKFLFWQRWLFVLSLLISLFGVAMSFLNGTALFNQFNRQIDPVFWSTQNITEEANNFQRWAYGVWGATIAGWGVMLAYIANFPFRKRETWSWKCLVAGLTVWYLLDSGLSIYFKVYFNAIFNTGLLILAAFPLVSTRKSFLGGRQ